MSHHMKKFDFRGKKSPVAGKKTLDPTKQTDFDDGVSDYTDSEPGAPLFDHDTVDGTRSATPDPVRTKEALETMKHKIDKIKMEIQAEQTHKEDNVKEYLELSNKAANDPSVMKNIKLVFEKKNQTSAQAIAKLQKKLERYQLAAQKIEQHGSIGHRHAKEVLKDVSQGLKDFGGSVVGNLKTATDALVSKPKEFVAGAKSKSGSADNINSIVRGEGQSVFYTGFLDNSSTNGHPQVDGKGSPTSPNGSTTLPANFSPAEESFKLYVPPGSDHDAQLGNDLGSASEASYHARDSPHNSSISHELNPQQHSLALSAIEPLVQKLNMNADTIEKLVAEVALLRGQLQEHQEEIATRAAADEERLTERYDRLEEHLNDFVELTQNELTNLKQEIANMEEKIDYQLDERTRDLQEALENANTRIGKLEVQNQHQQLIGMEVDNPNAKMLLTKCINVVLAFLAVILVFVSTISTIIGPFLNARWKVVSMVLLIFAIIFTSSRWELISDLIEQLIFNSRRS